MIRVYPGAAGGFFPPPACVPCCCALPTRNISRAHSEDDNNTSLFGGGPEACWRAHDDLITLYNWASTTPSPLPRSSCRSKSYDVLMSHKCPSTHHSTRETSSLLVQAVNRYCNKTIIIILYCCGWASGDSRGPSHKKVFFARDGSTHTQREVPLTMYMYYVLAVDSFWGGSWALLRLPYSTYLLPTARGDL